MQAMAISPAPKKVSRQPTAPVEPQGNVRDQRREGHGSAHKAAQDEDRQAELKQARRLRCQHETAWQGNAGEQRGWHDADTVGDPTEGDPADAEADHEQHVGQ